MLSGRGGIPEEFVALFFSSLAEFSLYACVSFKMYFYPLKSNSFPVFACVYSKYEHKCVVGK